MTSVMLNIKYSNASDTVFLHCLYICGKASQPDVESVSHREDFLEVGCNHLCLDAKPPV